MWRCSPVSGQRKSPGRVSAAPRRAQVPSARLRVAEDPRVRRTDPMCVWHSLGVINVFVRPPSLHSHPAPPLIQQRHGNL
ncbi:hypothetical protein PBY51_023199 [Eleginops maclovinus]|uniref:Uncharacterized protein n=1 Tax=Eleginops maclovinus TaxID=56733 RepID=A0AAN7WXX1_ELEMC|nr:hypothetical protein PBY51_023199 [Eleginops maclovinus]